jgi:hypothetical protein
MEAFEPKRRPGPEFEPPADPGAAPSLRGLGLVARIMRGREIAADAAGIPPLDSDQVLDLQRTAGNRLTSGALSRWTDALPGEVDIAQELLASLHADPGLRDAIAAALDALDPTVAVHVTGPAVPVAIDAIGPRGGATFHVTPPATVELPFNALFGPAAAIEPDAALELTIAAQHFLKLPLPFDEPATAGGYTARAELRS